MSSPDLRQASSPLAALRRMLWAAGAPIRLVLVGLIRLYRLTLGTVLGGQCKFYPSCSEYAEGAVRARGAIVGSVLAVYRVLRCNPFSRGGVDHPPGRHAQLSYERVILRAEAGR